MNSDIIVDPHGEEYVWVTCSVCDGMADDGYDACDYCDGHGEVREYLPDYDGDDEDDRP